MNCVFSGCNMSKGSGDFFLCEAHRSEWREHCKVQGWETGQVQWSKASIWRTAELEFNNWISNK